MIEYTIMQYLLIMFAFLLIIIGCSFIFSFVFKAPPVPSTSKVQKIMGDAIEKDDKNGKNIVDVGSGYGHMVFYMARRFPNKKIIGCEISFVPWVCSNLWKMLFRYKNVSFLLGNGFYMIETGKVKPSTAVFYLCPNLVKKISHIAPLIKNLVLANNFPLKNKKENKKIRANDWAKSIVYIYNNKI